MGSVIGTTASYKYRRQSRTFLSASFKITYLPQSLPQCFRQPILSVSLSLSPSSKSVGTLVLSLLCHGLPFRPNFAGVIRTTPVTMPVKRSRMVQSSSAGDTGVVSADNRWKNRTDPSTPVGKTSDSDKPREPHDQTRRTVLTLASPVREHIGVSGEEGGKIGNFLEKCYYCKKKIEEDSEVFMYSNLQAFCTAECREIHIAMEKELEKVAGQSAEPTTQQQGEKRTMDQFGLVHKGNHAGS